VSIPSSDDEEKPASSTPAPATPPPATPAPATPAPSAPAPAANRYGEAVVRELLKAEFIEEQQLAPRDAPVAFDVVPDDVPPPPEEDR
jgi:DNA polymerase-3 subunit gamma/tau